MSFIDDIQGKNTQLYPIVTIEPDSMSSYNESYDKVIHLSTNNVSLDHIHSKNYNLPLIQNIHFKPLLLNIPSIKESIDIESRRFKISNVSLDISNIEYEGKRFTDILSDKSLINWKCSIQFVSPSAKMFSTVFATTVTGFDSGGLPFSLADTSFYDYYKNNEEHAPFMTQMVYQGIIRRISHDDTKCKIELEDLTEQKAHKDLPQEYLGDGDNIPDKYRNKPIPMVYGHVDRTPLVVSENYQKLIVDSRDIKEDVEGVDEFGLDESPLYINSDDVFVNVKGGNPNGVSQFAFGENKYFSLNPSNQDIFPIDEIASRIFVIDSNKDFSLNIIQPVSSQTTDQQWYYLINDEFIDQEELNAITNGDTDINEVEFLSSRLITIDSPITGNNNIEVLLLRMAINYAPKYDFEGTELVGLSINGRNVSDSIGSWGHSYAYIPIFSEDVASHTENTFSDQVGGLSDDYWENDPNLTDGNLPQNNSTWNSLINFTNAGNINPNPTNPSADLHFDVQRSQMGNFISNSHKDADLLLLKTGGTPESLIIDFRTLYYIYVNHSDLSDNGVSHQIFDFSLTGNLNSISLARQVSLLKPLSKDFYANINGRINPFHDHPDAIIRFQAYSDEEIIQYASDNWQELEDTWLDAIWAATGELYEASDILALINSYFSDTLSEDDIFILSTLIRSHYGLTDEASFMQNPIDIIYDLVRSELGHDAIDENEYAEAKEAHDGWKFGFTVNKKINSKKLIEDIAKSTKCFPKFKNDGTFGFNTIKDTYTVSNIVDGVEKGDYNTATEIKQSEVISYSFKKTKPEQIYKKVTVSYNKDYAQDSYLKTTDPELYDLGADPYYGIEDSYDAHLEFESDYIRRDRFPEAEQTADKLASFLSNQYKNNHLIFNLKLPLHYINLEIGDLVKFRELFGGVKAYGIDYRRVDNINDQWILPLFIVTSTTKNLDSISIECMQLHHLLLDADLDGFLETINFSFDTGFFDSIEGGTFYFPDADPIVIEPFLEGIGTDDYYTFTIPENTYSITWVSGADSYIEFLHTWTGVPETSFYHFDWASDVNLVNLFNTSTLEGYSRYIRIEQGGIWGYYEITGGVSDIENANFDPKLNLRFISSYSGNDPIYYNNWNEDGALLITEIAFEDTITQGDVNQDNTLNILDIITVVGFIMGTEEFSNEQIFIGDLNEDGFVDILDIVAMVNTILLD